MKNNKDLLNQVKKIIEKTRKSHSAFILIHDNENEEYMFIYKGHTWQEVDEVCHFAIKTVHDDELKSVKRKIKRELKKEQKIKPQRIVN